MLPCVNCCDTAASVVPMPTALLPEPFRRQVELTEEPAFVRTFADFRTGLLEIHHGVANVFRGRDEQIHLALLGRRGLSGHLVIAAHAVLRLGALRARAGADPREFALQETLTATFGLLGDALTNGLRFEIRGVIPRMRKRAAIRDLDDARGDDIEEVTVVGDEDDRTGKVVQTILQPANGLGVEMVRRLVEQEQVGLRSERATQRHAAFFTTGKSRDQRVHRGHAQRVGLGLDARLEIPAVGMFDVVEDFAKLRLGAVAGLVFTQPFD